MSFNTNTQFEINKSEKELFEGKHNILGVQCRGSDFHSIHGTRHYTVPKADIMIEKVKEILIPWNVEWVYLATEEKETVDKFRSVFGDKLLVTNSERIENYRADMGCSSEVDFNRKHDKYYKGLECIIDIMLLSKCDSIICGKVNGAMAAIEYNGNKYKNKYIFDLGRNV